MSRQPAHLAGLPVKPTGRQAIWNQIRARPDGFSRADLVQATDIDRRTIESYLQCLVNAGILERGGARYLLVENRGVEAPRVNARGEPVTMGRGREQLWRTMKTIGVFSAADLAVMASTDTVQIAEAEAIDYCRHLAKAGYLLIAEPATRRKRARFRFDPSRNTGPKPPQIERTKIIYDANLHQVVWCQPVAET